MTKLRVDKNKQDNRTKEKKGVKSCVYDSQVYVKMLSQSVT